MRTLVPLASAALIFLTPELAGADPAPKVCVVVAGDPDVAARELAEALAARVAARSDLRAVADEGVAATLRGSAPAAALPSSEATDTLRRALDGTDADAPRMATLGGRLGCALIVEVVARPTGIAARSFDVVHGRVVHESSVTSLDDAVFDRLAVSPARAAIAPTPRITAPARPDSGASPPRGHARSSSATPMPRRPDPRVDGRAVVAAGNTGVWPWIIAGGAAAGLIVGFIVLQNSGPSSPVLSITHPAPSGVSP